MPLLVGKQAQLEGEWLTVSRRYDVDSDQQWLGRASVRICLSGVAKGGGGVDEYGEPVENVYSVEYILFPVNNQAAGGHITQALIPDLQGSLRYSPSTVILHTQ